MFKKGTRFIVVGSQLLLVGLFFMANISDDVKMQKYVSTIHNENLNKIASSVSLLFEEEVDVYTNDIEDELLIEDLPSVDVVEENESIEEKVVVDTDENESIPLVSIDASKYKSKESMGFKVTEDNKHYNLTEEEFDVVVAVVAGEYGGDLNDALAVVSVILNRCDSKSWSKWAGSNPYKQVIAAGQFEVYLKDYYLAYMPGGKKYGSTKYEVAKQAVIDGLNGIRNNEYLGFRAWHLTNYSSKYVVAGGNRYGYN